MDKVLLSRISLPLAVFGFMLIIATGFNMLLGKNTIPLFLSIIGLFLLIIAMIVKKKSRL